MAFVTVMSVANLGILLAIVAVWLGVAWLAGSIAQRKGGSFGVYAAAALVLGPVLGLLVAAFAGFLPGKSRMRRRRDDR